MTHRGLLGMPGERDHQQLRQDTARMHSIPTSKTVDVVLLVAAGVISSCLHLRVCSAPNWHPANTNVWEGMGYQDTHPLDHIYDTSHDLLQ